MAIDYCDTLRYIMDSRNQAAVGMRAKIMIFNLLVVTLAFAAPFFFVLICAASCFEE